MKKKIPKYQELLKKGIPAVLIPGIIFTAIYGSGVLKIKNYYNDKRIFPRDGVVAKVEDGDTFTLETGQSVRMVGVDAPNRGEVGWEESRQYLTGLIEGKKVWLEYDRYQGDKYGRILAWIWIDCENGRPKFLPANHMYLDKSHSKEYVTENAEGCKNGKLVNRMTVDNKMTKVLKYSQRGRLKYELVSNEP